MKARHWFFLTIACLALSFVFFKVKSAKSNAEPDSDTTSSTNLPLIPKAQSQQEETRVPASTGSQQAIVTPPTEARPVREMVGELRPVDVRGVQRGIANNYSKYRGLEQLNLPNGHYERLKLRAIPKDEYTGPQKDIITEKLGFVFVETANIQSSRPTVLNRANGMIGVITGTILVRTSDMLAARSLAQRLSLKVIHADESIGLIYFSTSPETAPNVLNSIKGTPSVTSASLEIVESEARF